MIDPSRTTRSREEHSVDSLYQTANNLYEAADIKEVTGTAECADALRARADRAWRRAENLEEAIASGYYGA